MGDESRIQFAKTNGHELTPNGLRYDLKTGSRKPPTSCTTEIVFYGYG
jgi:hypothetical protein